MTPRDGWVGWLAVAAVVIGWDAAGLARCHELLSEYAHRHRLPFVAGALYLALHFAAPVWFRTIDPLYVASNWIRRPPKEG